MVEKKKLGKEKVKLKSYKDKKLYIYIYKNAKN